MENTTCCLCGQEATRDVENQRTINNYVNGTKRGDIYRYNCRTCGTFLIDDYARGSGFKLTSNAIKVSAYTRKQSILGNWHRVIYFDINQLSEYNQKDSISLDEIISDFPKTIQGRLDNALINLAKMSDFTGKYLDISLSKDYPVFYPDNSAFSIASAQFMAMQLINDNYIEFLYKDIDTTSLMNFKIRLTHKGWNKVAELQSTNKNSKKVFVAMWFDKDSQMFNIFDNYIQPAVAEAKEGHNAIHIGKKEHNNDINDEIIAEIKTSKFVIADLTGDRGGVYYEAGFAKGLGIPVIFTCRSDWFNKEIIQEMQDKDNQEKKINIKINRKVHFDVSTINIIVWETGEELKTKLINRIRATID